jgi:adenylosuccinate lyase
MIPRYSRPEMAQIWCDDNKYRTWLKVEIAACEAQAELGHIPREALQEIVQKADFSTDRIAEIEKTVKHDVIAFLTNVAEYVGPAARYIHAGMTSSDLLDTALALQMRDAARIISHDIQRLREVLKNQALAHKETICVGRSHGIHAEPTCFGLKFALWYDEMGRNLKRFSAATESISLGMISGVVGTFALIDPRVEAKVCEKLGLRPAAVSTQVIQRDVHAEFMNALALIGCSIEKIAVEIRHLQRTEVLEAEEPFTQGQKGSSAMPHKRNPIGCENVSGLARLLRSNAQAAMENVTLWHERDISHSSVERIIVPDSCILADYALTRLIAIVEKLVIYPENMLRNLRMTHGLIFSQSLLLLLTEKGMSREDAYKVVQENAMRCWNQDVNFIELLRKDARITGLLSDREIQECFNEKIGLKHVDLIYKKAGIL